MSNKNSFSKWSSGYNEETLKNGHSEIDACTRITASSFANIVHNPKFKVEQDASVFAIGSCFAREIEEVLLVKGKRVLSREFQLDDEVKFKDIVENPSYYLPSNNKARIFTKFNTHSILHELEGVFGKKLWDQSCLIKHRENSYWNPQLHRLPMLPLDAAIRAHQTVQDTVRKIKLADIVIITLGLTEYFFDSLTGHALNTSPHVIPSLAKSERFRFENSSFKETQLSLDSIRELLVEVNPKVKIVITVSPVPLQRTFTDQDVVVANTYSKSQLRAAAHEICSKYEYIDYFPSYELAMNSQREKAWANDLRHVSREMVEHITNRFIQLFFENKDS